MAMTESKRNAKLLCLSVQVISFIPFIFKKDEQVGFWLRFM